MSEQERTIYRRGKNRWQPKKDWVKLSDGSWVCVWELSTAENFGAGEAAQRHPQDPRPGINETELAVWLVAYSCRDGEEVGAVRIWDDQHVHELISGPNQLAPTDFALLLQAARGLLGESQEAQERARDFTPPTPDLSSPPTPSGASSTSTGSRSSSKKSA